MAVNTGNLKKRLSDRFKKLKWRGLSKEEAEADIRWDLKEQWAFEKSKAALSWDIKKSIANRVKKQTLWQSEATRLWRDLTESEKAEIKETKFGLSAKKKDTPVIEPIVEPVVEPTVEEPIITKEQKTLREKVAWRIAWKKTEEQKLTEAREVSWRWELVDLQTGFREETAAVQEDLANIKAWLEAEWGAITNIAASRIREARSAPLREQLVSLVKWQTLTAASIKDMDTSIEAILKARELDRQTEVASLTAQIEWSTLSKEEKNKLIWQLGIQSKRMKLEEENEAFKQKEQIKADIKRQDEESIATTWLTTEQNLTYWKILTNAELKEDSVIWKSVASLIKEWKTEAEINKILALSTDEEWNFVSDTQFNRREKGRKEFEGKEWVKNFRNAAVQFAWLKDNIDDLTWAADIAVLFSFMKTLDPTSVVRESEFNSIANSAWVGDKIDLWNMLQWVKEWAKLWDLDSGQRQAVKAVAQTLFEKQQTNYLTLARNQIKQALRDWVDPRSVVLDLDEHPELQPFVTELDSEDEIWIDNIFGGSESSTWKQFKLDEKFGFNKVEQPTISKTIPTEWFTEKVNIARTWTNVAKDTNNPWNITADSIPAWNTKEEYGKKIGATWTYLSPNGREYFVFPNIESWSWALQSDIMAKISGRSRNIKPTDTLAKFQRVYVWEISPNYLAVLKRITWANSNTPIKNIDAKLLTQAVMKAEWFNS